MQPHPQDALDVGPTSPRLQPAATEDDHLCDSRLAIYRYIREQGIMNAAVESQGRGAGHLNLTLAMRNPSVSVSTIIPSTKLRTLS